MERNVLVIVNTLIELGLMDRSYSPQLARSLRPPPLAGSDWSGGLLQFRRDLVL